MIVKPRFLTFSDSESNPKTFKTLLFLVFLVFPRFLLTLLAIPWFSWFSHHFYRQCEKPWLYNYFSLISVQNHHSVLTGPACPSPQHPHNMSAGEAGRHVVGFRDLFIDVFEEPPPSKNSQLFYLIDYIAYGLHS